MSDTNYATSNGNFDSALLRARAIMHVANLTHNSGKLAQGHTDIVESFGVRPRREHGEMVGAIHGAVSAHADTDTQPLEHFFGVNQRSTIGFTDRPSVFHRQSVAPMELYKCRYDGQLFVPNGWTGRTPVHQNETGEWIYGERTWTCPQCGHDMRHQAQPDDYIKIT